MTTSVLVLGAGFGGLELSTRLSEELGDQVEITLIDRGDSFMFGFSKLNVMFGRQPTEGFRLRYEQITKPGVGFLQEIITWIDPAERSATTDRGTHRGDVLVIALGADLDLLATPGLAEIGNEFYSVTGAEDLSRILPSFDRGTAIIGVCGTPFKCPPAPSEAAILLDEYLRERGVRSDTSIKVVIPFGTPVPPSPATSEAILAKFAERGIEFIPGSIVSSLDAASREAVLSNGTRIPFDLFLGVPVHRVPAVIEASGLAENRWIPVDPQTLATRFPDVYAVGDVTSVGTAKAGGFAEGAARVVADHLIARIRGGSLPPGYDGRAACYVEFGGGEVARVDVDFFSTPGRPSGVFTPPSTEMAADKANFASSRRARWFGS